MTPAICNHYGITKYSMIFRDDSRKLESSKGSFREKEVTNNRSSAFLFFSQIATGFVTWMGEIPRKVYQTGKNVNERDKYILNQNGWRHRILKS